MKNITRKDITIYSEVRNYLEAESKKIFDYILKVIPKVNNNAQNETLRTWRVDKGVFSLLYSYIDVTAPNPEQPIMASFDLPVATVVDHNWKRWLDLQAKEIKKEMEEKEGKEAEKIIPPTPENTFGSDYDKDKETLSKKDNE